MEVSENLIWEDFGVMLGNKLLSISVAVHTH